jgi:hypothetical protein
MNLSLSPNYINQTYFSNQVSTGMDLTSIIYQIQFTGSETFNGNDNIKLKTNFNHHVLGLQIEMYNDDTIQHNFNLVDVVDHLIIRLDDSEFYIDNELLYEFAVKYGNNMIPMCNHINNNS